MSQCKRTIAFLVSIELLTLICPGKSCSVGISTQISVQVNTLQKSECPAPFIKMSNPEGLSMTQFAKAAIINWSDHPQFFLFSSPDTRGRQVLQDVTHEITGRWKFLKVEFCLRYTWNLTKAILYQNYNTKRHSGVATGHYRARYNLTTAPWWLHY